MQNANGAGVIEASTNSILQHMPATTIPPRNRNALQGDRPIRTAA